MPKRPDTKAGVFLVLITLAVSTLAAGVGRLTGAPQSDLDEFMERVLARRDENWKRLQQYILDEREQFELRGPVNVPIWGQRREYTWFIRDGVFVRSPRTANGVPIGDEERRKYEEEFLERAKARDRRVDRPDGTSVEPVQVPQDLPTDVDSLLSQTRQPQFIDSAYFLKFKFEQGKYALVGRERLENRDVLRIEYYPTRLFGNRKNPDEPPSGRGRSGRGNAAAAMTGQLMNKVALITLWVDPSNHQILKYTFDNLHLDFLPVAWLVRLDDLRASMTMSQPFPDVWLPQDVEMFFGATMATGSFTARYHIDYHDYREAVTSGRIKSVVVP